MIPLHGSMERVRENFALQFTPDGLGYLYRRNGRGPAIRVMADERDDMVAAFNRGMRALFWVFLFAAILLLLSFDVWPDLLPAWLGASQQGVVTVVVLAGFMIGWWRLSTMAERRQRRDVGLLAVEPDHLNKPARSARARPQAHR